MPNGLSIQGIINRMRPEEIFWSRKEAIEAIKTIIPIPFVDFFVDFNEIWVNSIKGFVDFLGPQVGFQIWQSMVKKFIDDFIDDLSGETAETILEVLLTIMDVRFIIAPIIDPLLNNGDFRRNILGFDGKYQFCSEEGGVDVLVKFADGDMEWEETLSPQVNVTTKFKDGPALTNFLFNFLVKKDRDILRALTRNEVRVTGNYNYLLKFLFMVNHMLLEARGNLPH